MLVTILIAACSPASFAGKTNGRPECTIELKIAWQPGSDVSSIHPRMRIQWSRAVSKFRPRSKLCCCGGRRRLDPPQAWQDSCRPPRHHRLPVRRTPSGEGHCCQEPSVTACHPRSLPMHAPGPWASDARTYQCRKNLINSSPKRKSDPRWVHLFGRVLSVSNGPSPLLNSLGSTS